MRCPAGRGSARAAAQRPLPSMMTAMCRGTPPLSFFAIRFEPRRFRPASALFLFRPAPGRSRRRACRSASALRPARADRRPATRSFSLSMSLSSFITSRRTLRTATRAFSASCRTTLVRSRRRSSVSGGIGTRITVPAVFGISPRSDFMIAFSIACTMVFSHGVTVMRARIFEGDVRDLVERHFVAVVLDANVLQQARCARGRCAASSARCFSAATHFLHALVRVFLDVFQHGRSPSELSDD